MSDNKRWYQGLKWAELLVKDGRQQQVLDYIHVSPQLRPPNTKDFAQGAKDYLDHMDNLEHLNQLKSDEVRKLLNSPIVISGKQFRFYRVSFTCKEMSVTYPLGNIQASSAVKAAELALDDRAEHMVSGEYSVTVKCETGLTLKFGMEI